MPVVEDSAFGVETLLDDITRVPLSVAQTILIQTHLLFRICSSHRISLINRTYNWITVYRATPDFILIASVICLGRAIYY
ncbi:hypothetical protein IPdc08_00168 [archaeon]|nr:hypothetical protein IPdc08_00168 [archaeon]